ncbi:glutaredoxin 3 [Derxia lacustris]|uniref:glutaredoxin 3 n=1 Tax=Derxia lacustris TaxID=764842 RepID=UPI000A1714FE|nr:glutaredoxin 3 [Derxia lacustris]
MAKIVMYFRDSCPYCRRAESVLVKKGVTGIEKLYPDDDDALKREMVERTGRTTVPQIFIDGKHVGGCDDLLSLDRRGGLDPLLAA